MVKYFTLNTSAPTVLCATKEDLTTRMMTTFRDANNIFVRGREPEHSIVAFVQIIPARFLSVVKFAGNLRFLFHRIYLQSTRKVRVKRVR